MGLFGRGIAFNNMFIPRGPIRFNCYQRQMPMMPRGPIFGGMSINETYTYKTNFWDALTAGLMTFAQTRMMFGGWGAGNVTQVTPQGTNNANASNLTQLRNLFQAKKVNIEETSSGKYTATDEKGNIIGKNLSFDEISDKLDKYNKTEKTGNADEAVNAEETDAQKQANAAKEKKNGEFSKVENSDDGNGNGNDLGADVGDGNRHVSRVRGSRVRGSDGSHQAATGYIGTIKHKAANGDIITKDEKGNTHFYKNDNGKYKEISEKEFRAIHNKAGKKSNINISNIKNGGYSSQKGTRVTGKAGRYAEKNGDSWNYYANDGTKLKPEYVKKVNPELWAKTHPKAKP